MSIFGDYSNYYDLIYKEKDYEGEAEYIDELIKRYRPTARTILDLGCGTGRHDGLLKQKGYIVHGVDISPEMLKYALRIKDDENLFFSLGDIRNIQLNKTFDAVISLFHVMCYQTGNQDLQDAFNTVSNHLNKDGIFIFDCWYGPAVLTDRPTVRIKRFENEETQLIRISEPVMHANENIVDVNYDIIVKDKINGDFKQLNETHRMRYLFKPEIEIMLRNSGINLEDCFEYMTNKEPDYGTWNVCFVGRKV